MGFHQVLWEKLLSGEFLDFHRTSVDRFVAQCARAVPHGAIVLDAGAGEGMYRKHFSHAIYLGFGYAIGDVRWDYSALSCICNLHAIPVRDGGVPHVLCTQTLEHIPRPATVLSELYRILQPGGSVFCSMPFLGDAHHQEPHDYYRYTKHAVQFLFHSAGFRDIVIDPFGGYYTLMVSHFQKGLIRFYAARRAKPLPIRLLALGFGGFFLFLSRWANRIAWRFDQRDADRYQFALGFAVTARK